VEHVIDFAGNVDVLGDVVVDEPEVAASNVLDVLERSRLEVVDADDPMALSQQVFAEVRAEKSRAPRDDSRAYRTSSRLGCGVAARVRNGASSAKPDA
jgi:hypothetical protein